MHNTTAIYAGSFDPVTLGHLDVIERASKLFDHLHILVGTNPAKKTLLSDKDRELLIKKSTAHLKNISVGTFSGLLVNHAKKIGASYLVRGLRSMSDFDYEMQLANINYKECKDIETIFIPTRLELSTISSSAVKELARNGGNISSYVNDIVAAELKSIFIKD